MKAKQLPEGWQEVALGEIASLLSGFAFTSQDYTNEGIKIIRIQNMGNNKDEQSVYWNKEYDPKYLVKRGDLLLSLSGTIPISFKIHRWDKEEALLNQRIVKIILNKSLADEKYISYAVFRGLVNVYSKATSTTGIANVSIGTVKSLKIILPPLATQKKIVSILEKAEKLKQKREEADKKTAEYLQSVFYEMFSGNKLPKKSIGELCEVIAGSTPSTLKEEYWNGEIDWVTPAELKDGDNYYYFESERKISEEGLKSISATLFPKGTVMLTTRAPIGKVAIAGKEMCTNQGFKNMVCKQDLNPIYLYCWLLFNKDYLNSLGVGATFKEISKSIVEKMKIPLPPLPLQQKFAKIVEKVEKLKEKQKESKLKIDELFNSLMQKAFKGGLRA